MSAMNDPTVDDPEIEATLSGRAQPGLKGVGFKSALLLILVGLAPVAALPVVLVPPSFHHLRILEDLENQVGELHRRAGDLASRVEEADEQSRDLENKLRLATFVKNHRLALERLTASLTSHLQGLPRGYPADLIKDEQSVVEALKGGSDPFSEVALLEIASRTVVLTRSGKEAGKLAEVLPDLASEWTPERPSPGPTEDWNWRAVGSTGYLVAVKSVPPSVAGGAKTAAVALPGPPPALADLSDLGQDMYAISLALSLALPLIALGLSLIGFWWLKARILYPVHNLTLAARRALEDPQEFRDGDLAQAGLLEDLAASLSRLGERMRRLQAQERQIEQNRHTLMQLKAAVERAAEGKLGLRVPVQPGDQQELALAVNRLLDAAVERIEGLRRVAQQIKTASESLQPVAERLSARLAPDATDNPPTEPGALGDLLDVQIEGLCKTAGHVAESFEQAAPEALENDELEEYKAALAATQAGFQLLSERITETTSASDRMAALHQEAEVLSTNLAISAEAKSQAQMERLVDSARSLSRSVIDLSDGLSKALGQLASSGNQLRDSFRRSSSHFQQAARQLVKWEILRRTMTRLCDEMSNRIELVRPGTASIGSDLRRMASSAAASRRLQDQLVETLQAAGRSATALSNTTAELLDLLAQLDTGKPAPAMITQRLVKQQQALQRAIQELNDLAAAEGIDSLSAEAKDILANIQAMAESARSRLLPEGDKETADVQRPEPEA